ncbi:MAG: substrate-binding domain-containing protein [Anaerolineae bacterium]|nr:substrate-binding domain-containing protein [Anaerolineae bacterium]NUQ02586.1 substrate-binding domain-containing protein [Anaerolineae bacterium]
MLILAVLMMALLPALTEAQDDASIRVVGSGLALPVLETIAAQTDIALETSIVGSSAGASEFCGGSADIAVLTRPLNQEEEAACTANGIVFREFLLGHNILTLVANATDPVPQCLTTDDLDVLFAPSATATNWSVIAGDSVDMPVTLFAPSQTSVAYALLDELVTGVELRRDAAVNTLDDTTAILTAVSATPGALGVLVSPAALPEGLRAVELDNGVSGCVTPTVSNVERRIYQAANRLFAYVDENRVEAASQVLERAFSAEGLVAVALADYSSPSDEAVTRNQAVLSDGLTGRQFSRDVTAFSISESLVGEIGIGGAGESSTYLQGLTAAFSTSYPGVVLNLTVEGVAAGTRKFCNGEIDILAASTPLTEDQLAACAQNNVIPESFYMGSTAAVVVTRADADYAICLTPIEVARLWGATDEGIIENWSALREGLPDLAVTPFSPVGGSLVRDLLVLSADLDQPISPRADADENADPAYRAAAVANVEGGVTFMSWSEYDSLPATERSRVQALAIEGSDGCVEASESALADGSYPLARSLNLLVRRLSLGRQDVQSLLWYAFSDANYPLFTGADLVGIPFDSLAEQRTHLETLFVEAAAEAAASVLSAVEATQEVPPAEVTPEATAEGG